MALEHEIYARLNADSELAELVDDRINPQTGTINGDLPHVTYAVTSAETMAYLRGVSSLERYSVQVDAYAVTNNEMLDVMEAVKTLLHGWSESPVMFSRLESYNTSPEEKGYHGTQSYSVWFDTAA